MALNLYKTFTREKLTYQDLNNSFLQIVNYINDYIPLSADCVATATANTIAKRDTLGNCAFNALTANSFVGNLTGNVTGNVTGNCSGSSGSCTGNAATATSLSGTTGGKWVEVVNNSFNIGVGAGDYNITLRSASQRKMYIFSVHLIGDTSGIMSCAYGNDSSYTGTYAYIKTGSGENDLLIIHKAQDLFNGTRTAYVKVWTWE